MLAVYGLTKPEPSNVLAWSQYLEVLPLSPLKKGKPADNQEQGRDTSPRQIGMLRMLF